MSGLVRAGRLGLALGVVAVAVTALAVTVRGSCGPGCAAAAGTSAPAGAAAGAAGGVAAPAGQHQHGQPVTAAGRPAATPTAGDPATPTTRAAPAAGRGDHGFRLNVPLPRPGFTLTDTAGRPYDFAARTRGTVTLLYFGYTSCPDQCPTMLGVIATALREVPPGVRAKVTVVFVTTDPARDTPAVLRAYLDQFDRAFVGLTGDRAAVEHAQQAAQVPVSRPAPETTKANPGSTAHGGGALGYGQDDYAHVTYPAGTSVGDLVTDLPALVAASTHG
jgi:protein SCO1